MRGCGSARTDQTRTLRRPAQLSLEMTGDQDQGAPGDDDQDHGRGKGDDPDAGSDDAPESLWEDHQLGPVQEKRGNPWRFSPEDQIDGDDIEAELDAAHLNKVEDQIENEDEVIKAVQNIVNLETDHQSQPSNEDYTLTILYTLSNENSDDDDIEEELDAGNQNEVEDNVTTELPKKPTIKNLRKRRKPKPKVRRK